MGRRRQLLVGAPVWFCLCRSAPPARMEGAKQKPPSGSRPSPLPRWEAQGSTRPAITSSTTRVLLSLEAAISSARSRPGDGPRAVRPHAASSSGLAKPTGLPIAHGFLRGTLGYQNSQVSEDVSASLCRKRVPALAGAACGCCPGSRDGGSGGSRAEPPNCSCEKQP